MRRWQLHISGLTMLQKCGAQFEFRYMRGIRKPPGVSLIVGTGTDAAITKDLQHKIDRAELLPDEQVKQIAAETVRREWNHDVMFDDEEKAQGAARVLGGAVDKAVRLASLHHGAIAPAVEPVSVQRSWSLDLDAFLVDRGLSGGIDLVGTIDVQDRPGLRDTKTSYKSPPNDAADTSDQLTAYALAVETIDGAAPDRVALDYLIDSKEPKTKTLESKRGEADFDALLNRVERAVRVIRSGSFAPTNPDNWWCSQKFCGYWEQCPFARRPVSVGVFDESLRINRKAD